MQSTCNETSIGKEFVPLFKAIECLDKFLQISLANGNNLCTMIWECALIPTQC